MTTPASCPVCNERAERQARSAVVPAHPVDEHVLADPLAYLWVGLPWAT